MRVRVRVRVRAGHRAAGAALVEADDAVVVRVEEAAAALVAAGAGAAMQEDGRHALRVPALLVVQPVPTAHVEHTRVVRLEWQVELCATRARAREWVATPSGACGAREVCLGLSLGAPVGYLAGLAACAAVSLAGGDTLRKSAFGTAPLAALSAIAAGACWLSRVSRPTLAKKARRSMCRGRGEIQRPSSWQL